MASKLSGIELTRYDDLFKTDAEREADRQERIQIVPAAEVFPYSRQPYTIDRPTPDLVRLMDSIEHIGIAEPLIVRPRESSGYEIISGHRRDYCAKAVGLDTRPVIVRNYSDEEADILVVDYNINREDLLPSEKAKAYKLKLDAMKRQGQRTDLTSLQLGEKLNKKTSVRILAEQATDNVTSIQRYVRLNKLIPPLLDVVDAGTLKFVPATPRSRWRMSSSSCWRAGTASASRNRHDEEVQLCDEMNYPMPAFPFCPPQGSLLSSKKARVAIIPPNGTPETARKTVTLPAVTT